MPSLDVGPHCLLNPGSFCNCKVAGPDGLWWCEKKRPQAERMPEVVFETLPQSRRYEADRIADWMAGNPAEDWHNGHATAGDNGRGGVG